MEMKRIWNDRTRQERRRGPTAVGGWGGATGGRLQRCLIDMGWRSAAGGPSWSLKEASWLRTHGGQTNTPVQTREMTRRRWEEDG